MIIQDIEGLLRRLKAKEYPVEFLRIDGGTEWNNLEPLFDELGITVKRTAPNTPQFNAKVEREYPTIRNMAYACMMASWMEEEQYMLYWAYAIQDCTLARNLQARGDFANAFEAFGEKPPVKPKDLIPWGAKGWMTKRRKIKTKWTPNAVRITRLGYATDHSSDTYTVLKHDTNRVVESRDIKWDEPRRYRKLAPEKTRGAIKSPATEGAETPAPSNRYEAFAVSDSEEEEEEDDADSSNAADSSDDDSTSSVTSLSALPATERRRLEGAKILGSRTRSGKIAAIKPADTKPAASKCPEPANDREAKESPEVEQWWQGTLTEYDGFLELGTWKLVKAKDAKLDHGNKPLTTKNVYKRKQHAITKAPRFRVRNCVRGFEMIPGVHFDESFAPTPTTSTHRIAMELSLYMLSKLSRRT